MRTSHFWTIALAATLLSVGVGCKDSTNPPTDPRPDAGPTDTDGSVVVPCTDAEFELNGTCCKNVCDNGRAEDGCACLEFCEQDMQCPEGKRCDDLGVNATRKCVDAYPCTNDPATEESEAGTYSCQGESGTANPNDYCKGTAMCRCVPSTKATGEANGFCVRQLPVCWPCTKDAECGSLEVFGADFRSPARCVDLPATQENKKVCLALFDQVTCDCGESKEIGGNIFCAPLAAAQPTCQTERAFECCVADYIAGTTPNPPPKGTCPAERPLCNWAKQVCTQPCNVLDWAKDPYQYTVCASDEVCHVMEDYVNEKSLQYAAGRCGLPCERNDQCLPGVKPGFTLECVKEDPNNPKSGRCRPKGCLNDLECGQSNDPEYNSFCNKQTNACICDPTAERYDCFCRGIENNPDSPFIGELWTDAAGNFYNACNVHGPDNSLIYDQTTPMCDCKVGFKCNTVGTLEMPVNKCVKKDCVDAGGAQNECGTFAMCCGEEGTSPPNDDYNPYYYNPYRAACARDLDMTDLAPYGYCYRPPNPPESSLYCKLCEYLDDCFDAGLLQDPKPQTWALGSPDPAICINPGICAIPCSASVDCPSSFACVELPTQCIREGATLASSVPQEGSCGGNLDNCKVGCVEQLPDYPGVFACGCACQTPFSLEECSGFEESDGLRARCSQSGTNCVFGNVCSPGNYGVGEEKMNVCDPAFTPPPLFEPCEATDPACMTYQP